MGGAPEDEEAVKEHLNGAHTHLTVASASLTESEVLERQGPSVHHLNTDFITNTLQAVSNQMSEMIGITDPAGANIHHMNQAYGKPAGLTATCPRDGEPGAAYVDILSGEDNVGIANALLSYSWGYKVQDVVDALAAWTEKEGRSSKETYIWICSLCLNQHRIVADITPEQLASQFGERVTGIGRVLPMLEDWRNPGYVKRAWCLFELYTAIRMKSVKVDIILTPAQREACMTVIKVEGFPAIDNALSQVKSEEATASVEADLKAIQALITSYQGGYTALNEAVKVRLRSWFQNIAGIRFLSDKVSTRRVTSPQTKPARRDSATVPLLMTSVC